MEIIFIIIATIIFFGAVMRISLIAIRSIMRLLRLLSGILVSAVIVVLFVLLVGSWASGVFKTMFGPEPPAILPEPEEHRNEIEPDTVPEEYLSGLMPAPGRPR